MNFNSSNTQQRSFLMGAVAGMRAMSAPAILSNHFADSPSFMLNDSSLKYMQKSGVATGLKVLSVAEFIGDLIPKTPDRISPMQMLPRVLSGVIVGATIAEANNESKVTGALLGAVGAVAASYAFFYLRKKLGKITGLPDATFALLEDVLALKAGAAILKS